MQQTCVHSVSSRVLLASTAARRRRRQLAPEASGHHFGELLADAVVTHSRLVRRLLLLVPPEPALLPHRVALAPHAHSVSSNLRCLPVSESGPERPKRTSVGTKCPMQSTASPTQCSRTMNAATTYLPLPCRITKSCQHQPSSVRHQPQRSKIKACHFTASPEMASVAA